MTTIGVAIPTIAPRTVLLRRALTSVLIQSRPPDAISVARDADHDGAATTRNRAWRALDTDWVAFLDDDDEFMQDHLQTLENAAQETGADLVYPWFEMAGGTDPLSWEGHEFDEEMRHYILNDGNGIPVTVLVRRDALVDVGGFPQPASDEWWHTECEDWGLWQRLLKAGCRFHHVPRRTWVWHHHAANLSGRGDRW